MPYIKSDGKRIVIALGGNALGNTPQEQLELVKHTAACIVDMVAEGNNVIVTHGNGPQVGMINNAFAFASQHDEKTPEMPFPEAGAMSQGYIGYQLSQAILNELRRRGIMRSTANVVTQTVVYPDDPAFQNPTKPVGAFLTEEEAKAKAAELGVDLTILVPFDQAGAAEKKLIEGTNGRCRIEKLDEVYFGMDDGKIILL